MARLSDWLSLLALTLLWGTAFMFNEIALTGFGPATLVAGRTVAGLVVLVFALRLSGADWLPGRGAWRHLAVMALFGVVLPLHLVAWAQQHIDSSLTAVLMSIMPLFVLTLAHFFLPGERLTPLRVAGFALGFAGVVVVLAPRWTGAASAASLAGMLAAIAAALSYALNAVYARRVVAARPTAAAVGVTLVASLLTLPAALMEEPAATLSFSPAALGALLVLGVLCTGVASVLYFRIVSGPGPAFLSLVNYLIPVWAVLAGGWLLGEPVGVSVLAGLALMLAGIALSEFGVPLAARLGRLRVRAGARRRLQRDGRVPMA